MFLPFITLKNDGFDFQGTKLNNAWWERIDAREVDFFEASII